MYEFSAGFEENEGHRSDFIRSLTLRQLERELQSAADGPRSQVELSAIPRRLVQYWHDPDRVPADVRRCLDSWEVLRGEGFDFRFFDDRSAAQYIAEQYGPREIAAFRRCRHPAMRSDYLRMCFVLAEGGLYVDADDVLEGENWDQVFRDGKLKLQPLCYDLAAGGMLPAAELRRTDLSTERRIFYVNNNPIAAPPGHPILRLALNRATSKLLSADPAPEIQSTTGPGNLTTALVAHAFVSPVVDFELLMDWEQTASPCWELSYRQDERNWRNMSQ